MRPGIRGAVPRRKGLRARIVLGYAAALAIFAVVPVFADTTSVIAAAWNP